MLSEAEMNSIIAEGSASPFTEKYTTLRSEAGKAMQESSQDLFRTILAEVIGETQRVLAESADQ